MGSGSKCSAWTYRDKHKTQIWGKGAGDQWNAWSGGGHTHSLAFWKRFPNFIFLSWQKYLYQLSVCLLYKFWQILNNVHRLWKYCWVGWFWKISWNYLKNILNILGSKKQAEIELCQAQQELEFVLTSTKSVHRCIRFYNIKFGKYLKMM